MTTVQFFEEVRANDKNLSIYNLPASVIKGKQLKDMSISLGEDNLRAIEENVILKRWKSPSIVEALQFPHALRMIIFCTAVFFKYRVVNKRMQLYASQVGANTGDILNVRINLLK